MVNQPSGGETDATARRFGRSHQLPNRVEHHSELLVILAFHRIEAASQIAMGCQDCAQLDEGAHDGDVHLDCAGTAQDAGEHGHALLNEGIGSGSPRASPT